MKLELFARLLAGTTIIITISTLILWLFGS